MPTHPRSHSQRPASNDAFAPLNGFLKRSVAVRLCREIGENVPDSLFRRALLDAEALADSTGYPNLFFPVLAEEKVRLMSAVIAPGTMTARTRDRSSLGCAA